MISQRMQAVYDRIAPEFATRHATMPSALIDLAEAFLAQLPPEPTILDAGCGTGRDMAWFETRGATVTGIDLSPGMLAQARPHVSGSLLEMDLTAIDLPSASVDGVWCNAALLHVPKATAPDVLAQFRRVLKPEGTLMLGLQAGTSDGWEASAYGNVERYFARYQPAEITQLLASADFTLISLTEHPGTVTWLHLLATSSRADQNDNRELVSVPGC